jgi:hypothetical protein
MSLHFLLFKLCLTDSDILKLNYVSGHLVDIYLSLPKFNNANLDEIRQLISTVNYNLSALSRKYLRSSAIVTSYELNVSILKLSTAIELIRHGISFDLKSRADRLEVIVTNLTEILTESYAASKLPEFDFEA